jgi:hypoxanthine-DNA glycosylase
MINSFDPIADSNSKILILGTMPGERSLKLQQYYGHKGNHFWKIMFTLFEVPMTDQYSEKVSLLKAQGIALWDVLQYCERTGSADSAIEKEFANDFKSFHANHPNIKTIFFASKDAMHYYMKHIGESDAFAYHLLPSPSSANTWTTFAQKVESWRSILPFLK